MSDARKIAEQVLEGYDLPALDSLGLVEDIVAAIECAVAEEHERYAVDCGRRIRQVEESLHLADKAYADALKSVDERIERAVQDRDDEWWDSLGGVPGVDRTPEACKRWQMTLQEQAKREEREAIVRHMLKRSADLRASADDMSSDGATAEIPGWARMLEGADTLDSEVASILARGEKERQ